MKTASIYTPLSSDDIHLLELGDLVYLYGIVFTCRGLFQKRIVENGVSPPINTQKINVMVHMGPIIKKVNRKFEIVSMGPTTSNRFEKWGPKIIEKLGLRCIVGKGTMGPATAEAMKKFGCVHLTSVGNLGPILPLSAKVKEVHWLELGPLEAVWVLEVKNFGPFMVDIDARGNRYFEMISKAVNAKKSEIYKKLGIPEDFEYQPL